jgi:hypothetical protein
MIPIKVQCDCGQKYAFDVEPIHGRMPAPVACPVCGADGTAKANAMLGQALATAQPAMAPSPAIRLAAAPVAIAVSAAPPPIPSIPPPIPAGPSRAAVPGRPIRQPPKRGKDGWDSDETGINKLGTYIVTLPALFAGLITWGIFGVEVSAVTLCIVVGVCGVIGGILNVLGRGPLWAGAILGPVMGLGGYGAVYWWIRGRASAYKFELAIAFALGCAPALGLQRLLQMILRKRAEGR